jgi:hypothetical protein
LRNDFAAAYLSLISAPGKICRLNGKDFGKDLTNEYHERTDSVRIIHHSRLFKAMASAQQDMFQHNGM